MIQHRLTTAGAFFVCIIRQNRRGMAMAAAIKSAVHSRIILAQLAVTGRQNMRQTYRQIVRFYNILEKILIFKKGQIPIQ